jgi:sec-independent protein translocase protein TatC
MSYLQRLFRFRESADTVKPFLEHMEELRWTLIKVGVTLGAAMALSFAFRSKLVRVLQWPLQQVDPDLVSTLRTLAVTDSLMISLQLAFYAGIVISFPLLLFFLAQFVLPALTAQEKKYVVPAIGGSFALFLIGVLFGFYFVLPQTLAFFFHDAQSLQWTPAWTVRDYFSFVTRLTLAFGVAFELPVVVLALVRLGIVNFDLLSRTRPYAIVIILLIAVVLAPTPDVLTFLSLGIPMCLLYEGCIWLAWLMERMRRRAVAAEMS